MAQIHKAPELLHVVHRKEVHVIGGAGGGGVHHLLIGEHVVRHSLFPVQIVLNALLLLLRQVLVQAHGGVIQGDLVKLLIQHVENGLVEAKARDNQGSTAANADDRHPKPLLIAEQVAHGHLPGKA